MSYKKYDERESYNDKWAKIIFIEMCQKLKWFKGPEINDNKFGIDIITENEQIELQCSVHPTWKIPNRNFIYFRKMKWAEKGNTLIHYEMLQKFGFKHFKIYQVDNMKNLRKAHLNIYDQKEGIDKKEFTFKLRKSISIDSVDTLVKNQDQAPFEWFKIYKNGKLYNNSDEINELKKYYIKNNCELIIDMDSKLNSWFVVISECEVLENCIVVNEREKYKCKTKKILEHLYGYKKEYESRRF